MLIFASFWPTWDATPTVYLHWLAGSPAVLRQRYSDNSWRTVPTVSSE